MTLRSKSLHWNRNTFRKAMDIANSRFTILGKYKLDKSNYYDDDWIFRK